MKMETQHRRWYCSDADAVVVAQKNTAFTTTTRADANVNAKTSTALAMIENESENRIDPDVLLQMAEELAMEEYLTSETMAKIEEVQIALADFLDETSAALSEQQETQTQLLWQQQQQTNKPPPPPIPPPGDMLASEGFRDRDLATDLATAGTALELLQQRLQQEDEALLEEEQALQQQQQGASYGEAPQLRESQRQFYDETQQPEQGQQEPYAEEPQPERDLYAEEPQPEQVSYGVNDDQDILLQAEDALRKSREAAERRKLEADRRSVTAARVSAGYRRQQIQEEQQQEERDRWQQMQERQQQEDEEEERLLQEESTPETFDGVNPYVEETPPNSIETCERDSDSDSDYDVPRTNKRPTMELGSLLEEGWTRGTPGTAGTNSNSNMNSNSQGIHAMDDRAPEGVPILCNWVQDEEGCITGNIRGSMNFRDGAKISTSSVSVGARGGTTVVTGSGSRYFLEETTTAIEEFYVPEAPDGVPTVKSWEVRSGGGILGLIYGSPFASDGDYIETSPIVDGTIDNFSVVSTRSGSMYFLSGDPPESSFETMEAFQNTKGTKSRSKNRKQGTITLSKATVQQGDRPPRSTFSLSDLFGGSNNENDAYDNAAPEPLPPPSPDKAPPPGTPALTGCVFNQNGTITGYVFGSPKIRDGVLITTSPIVYGEKRQFETVTTASGSIYFLG